MSEGERDAFVSWLDDPPETWEDAPDSPPVVNGDGPEVTASQAGGLLLREAGSGSRFMFTNSPIKAKQ